MLILLTLALLAPAPAERPAVVEAERDKDRAVLREALASAPRAEHPYGGITLPRERSPGLQRWLNAHAQSVSALAPSGLAPQPWGLSAARPNHLVGKPPDFVYLYLFEPHDSGKLVVYGLTGGVTSAHPLGDEDTDLPMERIGNSLVITLPDAPRDPLATVIQLHMKGKPQVVDLAARPGADGRIVMHARDAVVHGRTLRYEPEPHKDTLGYWKDPADRAEWTFEVTKPGKYALEILQGCGKNSGGSVVEFAVGDQVFRHTVEDTGHFQNFVPRTLGVLRLDKPGRYTLSVKPTQKKGSSPICGE